MHPHLLAARPEDVGVDSEKLEALFARVRRDVDQGVLASAQVAITGSSPTPTATFDPAQPCRGDCNDNGTVTVNELVRCGEHRARRDAY